MEFFKGFPVTVGYDEDKRGALLRAKVQRAANGDYRFLMSNSLASMSQRHQEAVLEHEYGHYTRSHLEHREKTGSVFKELEADSYAVSQGYGEELKDVLNLNMAALDKETYGSVFNKLSERVQNMDAKINGKFSDFGFSVFHVDTETTGLNPKEDSIWSIGTAKHKMAGEVFVGNKDLDRSFDTFLDKSSEQSIFQKKQVDKLRETDEGPFAAFREAYVADHVVSQAQGAEFLKKQMHLAGGGMFLAQNVNFENSFLTQMVERDGRRLDIADQMLYLNKTSERTGRGLFYRPPQITRMDRKSSETFSKLLEQYTAGQDTTKTLNSYVKQRSLIISRYEKETMRARDAGKYISGDLQDFTKALYASATKEGHLGIEALKARTTNVDFLAQVFLNEQEAHTAKSDAIQQQAIFDKMYGMYKRLQSKTVTTEDTEQLRILKEALPESRSLSMWSSARQTVEAFTKTGYHRWSTNTPGNEYDVMSYDTEKNKTINIKVRNYDQNEKLFSPLSAAEDYKLLLDQVANKYPDLKSSGELRDLPTGNYEQLLATIDSRADAEKANLSTTISNIRANLPKPPPIAEAVPRPQSTKAVIEKFADLLPSKITRKQAIGGAIALGLGLFALSGKSDEEQQKETRIKDLSAYIKAQGNTPNAVFAAFNYNKRPPPILYSGGGFYDFENRTRHHEA